MEWRGGSVAGNKQFANATHLSIMLWIEDSSHIGALTARRYRLVSNRTRVHRTRRRLRQHSSYLPILTRPDATPQLSHWIADEVEPMSSVLMNQACGIRKIPIGSRHFPNVGVWYADIWMCKQITMCCVTVQTRYDVRERNSNFMSNLIVFCEFGHTRSAKHVSIGLNPTQVQVAVQKCIARIEIESWRFGRTLSKRVSSVRFWALGASDMLPTAANNRLWWCDLFRRREGILSSARQIFPDMRYAYCVYYYSLFIFFGNLSKLEDVDVAVHSDWRKCMMGA
jgi:hypothetical protein